MSNIASSLMKYCRNVGIDVSVAAKEESTIITFDNAAMVRTPEEDMCASEISNACTKTQINKGQYKELEPDKYGFADARFDDIVHKCTEGVTNTYFTFNTENVNYRIFVTPFGINTYNELYVSMVPLVTGTYTDVASYHEGPLYIKGFETEMLISPCFTDVPLDRMINLPFFQEESV